MKFFLFSVFAILPFITNSQLIRKVVDTSTNLPVPFATIKILNKPQGVVASEEVQFNLVIDKSDSVSVSSVGYYELILTGGKIGAIIYLAPKIKTLKDVKLGAKEIIRTLLSGNKNVKFKAADNWGPFYSDLRGEIAQRIELPDSTRTYRIRKIFIPVSKMQCWGSILIHVYTINPLNSLPGEELFMKFIQVNEKNVRKLQLEIEINDPGLLITKSKFFFVSVSWAEDVYSSKCLTGITTAKNSEHLSYIRHLSNENYSWSPFRKFKNSDGIIYEASTMYSVLLEELQ